ncbi:hypothetical protein GCM10011391_31660 [Pullulanibacillus camelliae]|uniref:DNA-binding protein n=1 Tax=Pullulanibacillus camelliae TaxID=1707096 RepID=A0A8J2YKH7_9BACL|nr:hypothetical protein [Pullulanibacillus camelliae]GGE50548.1 hypothetical protein GCM10011391_31660 [Pullulanibacillus camelliae]
MNKEVLYERIHTMIQSSTKRPKYMALSTVKLADLLGEDVHEVENTIQEFVKEGRLQKSELTEAPHSVVYSLPS